MSAARDALLATQHHLQQQVADHAQTITDLRLGAEAHVRDCRRLENELLQTRGHVGQLQLLQRETLTAQRASEAGKQDVERKLASECGTTESLRAELGAARVEIETTRAEVEKWYV